MSKRETEHLEQAKHNQSFLDYLQKNVPNDFFDWKVTVSFYTCLHQIRAYLCKSQKDPGKSHHDVLCCINYKQSDNNPTQKYNGPRLAFPKKEYTAFEDLYLSSKNARYDGFLRRREFEALQQQALEDCKENMGIIKEFLISRGLKLKEPSIPNDDSSILGSISYKSPDN